MGFGTSLFLIAVGAVMDFAIKAHTTGVNLHTIGLILMIVGAVGLALSLLFSGGLGTYRRTSRVSAAPSAAIDGNRGVAGREVEYIEEERRF